MSSEAAMFNVKVMGIRNSEKKEGQMQGVMV